MAAGDPILARTVARHRAACTLRCLDELSDLHWTATAPSCCLQVLTEHTGAGSRSPSPPNAPFSAWARPPADPRLAAAIVDRLTFHALIVETGSESSRLRATRSRKKGAPKPSDHTARPGAKHRVPSPGRTPGWGHF